MRYCTSPASLANGDKRGSDCHRIPHLSNSGTPVTIGSHRRSLRAKDALCLVPSCLSLHIPTTPALEILDALDDAGATDYTPLYKYTSDLVAGLLRTCQATPPYHSLHVLDSRHGRRQVHWVGTRGVEFPRYWYQFHHHEKGWSARRTLESLLIWASTRA